MKRFFVFSTVIISAVAFSLILGAAHAATPFTGNEWVKLKNVQKVAEVKAFINNLSSQGVVVKGDPIEYCRKLDRFYIKHSDMKGQAVARTLKTIIIMQYDWEEKGVDKDALAKQWLGEELYKKNKARRAKK